MFYFIIIYFKASDRRGRLSLSWGLGNNVNLVLFSFKDNLFARNHSDTFSSSKFDFKKNGFISLFGKNKLVQSAKMIDFKNFDLKDKTFIKSIERSGPKIDPCGTPHIVSNNSVFSKLLFKFLLLLLLISLLLLSY